MDFSYRALLAKENRQARSPCLGKGRPLSFQKRLSPNLWQPSLVRMSGNGAVSKAASVAHRGGRSLGLAIRPHRLFHLPWSMLGWVMPIDPPSLNKAEAELLKCCLAGSAFQAAGELQTISLRGELISSLLLGHIASQPAVLEATRLRGIHIVGASIKGDIDLASCTASDGSGIAKLVLKDCRIDGRLLFSDSTIAGLDLSGSRIVSVEADGGRFKSDVKLDGVLPIVDGGEATLSLRGATIEGKLSANAAVFRRKSVAGPPAHRPGYAFAASEARIAGRVDLIGACIHGGLTLAAAVVEGDVVARALIVDHGDDEALNLRGARIRGSVYLESAKHTHTTIVGRLYLAAAKVEGSVRLHGASLRTAVNDRAKSVIDGRAAQIGGDLSLKAVNLAGTNVRLTGIRVEQTLDLAVASAQGVRYDLTAAKIGVLADRGGLGWGAGAEHILMENTTIGRLSEPSAEAAPKLADRIKAGVIAAPEYLFRRMFAVLLSRWRQLQRIVGVYHRDLHLFKKSSSWRLRSEWFRHLVETPGSYEPHAYVEFAKALRSSGREEEARRLLRHKRWRYLYERESVVTKPVSFLFGALFAFGYSTSRALVTVLLLIAAGGYATYWANANDLLIIDSTPVSGIAVRDAVRASRAKPGVQSFDLKSGFLAALPCGDAIDPTLYAIDVFVPLIDLRQESRCEPGDAAAGLPETDQTNEKATSTNDAPSETTTEVVPDASSKAGDSAAAVDPLHSASFWRWAKSLYAFLGWIIMSLAILTFSGVLQRRDD